MTDPSGIGDLHSHLVPGVDDGARTLDDTLESVERMTRAGVDRIITTPHLDGSLTHDRRALEERLTEVDAAFDGAAAAVQERFGDLPFLRGHEVMIDVPNPDLSDARVRLGGTSFVLIEWPRLQLPPRTDHVVAQIRERGYRPVIAHAERYVGMRSQISLAGEWRRLGAVLQVNYGALLGRYGKDPQAVAVELLAKGWVDCLSSDFHARSHLKLYIDAARDWFEERGGQHQFQILSGANPTRIFSDAETLPVPPLVTPPGLWKRMRRILRS